MNNSVFRLMSDSCTSNLGAGFGGKRGRIWCLFAVREAVLHGSPVMLGAVAFPPAQDRPQHMLVVAWP